MRGIPGWARVLGVLVCGGLFVSAPNAWAKTINVNARARVAIVSSSGGVFQLAGAVSDPSISNGGLLVTVHPAAGGYAGTATFVNRSGSVAAAVRVAARVHGQLVHLSLTAPVKGASGEFAGARGTLSGAGTVTAVFGVGVLRLHGTLRGVSGRAPKPLRGAGVVHVHGRFQGSEVRLSRSGKETVIGVAAGLVPGPAIVVAHLRSRTTSVRGNFTLFASGGSLSGSISLRFRNRGAVRSESGTGRVTGGSGYLRGAHSTSPAIVSGTRSLKTQQIVLRFRGAFRP